ncbi:MAG: class I SAM-dependent methyltransferase [Candidatus Methanoperedens sp.]|nr:class I SAM-dependent methyltransferase [Candidatus Methanoperedens sp.]
MKPTWQEEFRAGVIREYRDEYQLRDWQAKVEKRMTRDLKENTEKITELEKMLPYHYHQPLKILSVGSGWGGFVLSGALRGHEATGIDPDAEHIRIAMERANELGVSCTFLRGVAEDIQLPSGVFDLVDCHSVLEHVQDVKKSISEMIRVMKVGGMCHLHAPNYIYPTEPHNQVFRIPYTPKTLYNTYLRLIGRNTTVADSLNYPTKMYVNRILSHYTNIKVIDTINENLGAHSGKLKIEGTGKSKMKRRFWNIMESCYQSLGVSGAIHKIIIKKE